MSAPLFYQLLLCAVDLAVFLFAIQVNGILQAIICVEAMLSVLVPTYIYCFLSEMVTIDLYAIGDHFFNFPWYLLPAKHQLLFQWPIQRSQSEYRLMGMGMVECSLGVFSAVGETIVI